jgi:hypothetical protein
MKCLFIALTALTCSLSFAETINSNSIISCNILGQDAIYRFKLNGELIENGKLSVKK